VVNYLTPELYTIFWYISLPNLYVPNKVYSEESEHLVAEIQKQTEQKNKKEVERLQKLSTAIPEELQQ
jgi:hypothetical protein